MAAVGLISALAVSGFGCGAEELTAEQQTAYRQVVAYWTHPAAVVERSLHDQQAAAKQFRRNLRTLQDTELGEDEDAALRTLSTCEHEVTDGSKPYDGAKCDEALATVRAAVEERLE